MNQRLDKVLSDARAQMLFIRAKSAQLQAAADQFEKFADCYEWRIVQIEAVRHDEALVAEICAAFGQEMIGIERSAMATLVPLTEPYHS